MELKNNLKESFSYDRLWNKQEKEQEKEIREDIKEIKEQEVLEDLEKFDFRLAPENSNKPVTYIKINQRGYIRGCVI